MASYVHLQTAAASTWTVTHDLDESFVVCDCMVDYNGNLEKILPSSIEHVDSNTVVISFGSNRTGKARVVS